MFSEKSIGFWFRHPFDVCVSSSNWRPVNGAVAALCDVCDFPAQSSHQRYVPWKIACVETSTGSLTGRAIGR